MTAAVRASLAIGLLLGLLAGPSPGQPEPAVPAPRGYVSDYVGVLSPGTVNQLTGLIGELRTKTGAEIAVVVMRSVQPLSTFDFAMKVAEAWKVGSKEHDNGVVFLVAVADRDMYILTGYGVEGALPDGLVGEIRDTLVIPAFRRGDYDGGIRAATSRMAEIIATDRNVKLSGVSPQPERGRQRPAERGGFIPLAVLLIIFFLAMRGQNNRFHRRRRRFGGPFGPLGGGFGGFGGGGFGGGGFGGFGGGGGGGGFGGFGGGDFGGGGAGGRW